MKNKNSMRSSKTFLPGFLLFLSVFCGAAFSQDSANSIAPFSLRLSGGGIWAAIGDMNTHLASLGQRYPQLSGVSGGIEKLHRLSGDWEIELRVETKTRFAFGFAASYTQGGNTSSLSGHTENGYDSKIVVNPETRIIMPLGLRVYYSVYSHDMLKVYLVGGAGWYSARMKEAYEFNAIYPLGDIYYNKRYWDAKNNHTLGFVGGMGLEFRISKHLSFTTELQARSLMINEFLGAVRYETNYGGGLTFGETGTLHFFSMGDYYDIDVPLPIHFDAAAVQDVERNARLDLSGVALRIGVKVGLF
jgi:opacity protein-like surface antigen